MLLISNVYNDADKVDCVAANVLNTPYAVSCVVDTTFPSVIGVKKSGESPQRGLSVGTLNVTEAFPF